MKMINNIKCLLEDKIKKILGKSVKVATDSTIKEAAEDYEQNRKDTDARSDNEIVRRAFIAGAEWQAKKCDEETSKLLYGERQTAYINGWDDHKKQMLKDAFVDNYIVQDGRIELEGEPLPCLDPILLLPYPQFKPDDKVCIIVLKDNENESK